MDKLQKFFKGIWRYKERIVLAILVCVLAYRVYELFGPGEQPEQVQAVTIPPEPPEIAPNAPAPDPPGQYGTLVRRSPFSYYSDAKVDTSGPSAEELGLKLLRVKEVGGKWRAQVTTPAITRGKWYDEGESFEEFVLESIDPEAGTADVYVERLAKTITLRLR